MAEKKYCLPSQQEFSNIYIIAKQNNIRRVEKRSKDDFSGIYKQKHNFIAPPPTKSKGF